jgi:hypothetical protein
MDDVKFYALPQHPGERGAGKLQQRACFLAVTDACLLRI